MHMRCPLISVARNPRFSQYLPLLDPLTSMDCDISDMRVQVVSILVRVPRFVVCDEKDSAAGAGIVSGFNRRHDTWTNSDDGLPVAHFDVYPCVACDCGAIPVSHFRCVPR